MIFTFHGKSIPFFLGIFTFGFHKNTVHYLLVYDTRT
jgi:hypothetical protein